MARTLSTDEKSLRYHVYLYRVDMDIISYQYNMYDANPNVSIYNIEMHTHDNHSWFYNIADAHRMKHFVNITIHPSISQQEQKIRHKNTKKRILHFFNNKK